MTQQTQTKKPKTEVQRFSKAAFVASAASTKERLEFEVILEEGKTYSKEEAAKAINSWKNSTIKKEAAN